MARRFSGWWKPTSIVLLGLIIARGGACGACTGADRAAPDERLATHFARLCDVAEDGVDDPQRGVRKMMRYYGDHGPDMLEAFGAMLVMIERIDDDTAHDRRARKARDRIHAPILACADTWEEFASAIDSDPEAAETLEHGIDRLVRTLEILTSAENGAGTALHPLDPRRLLRGTADLSR